MRRLDPSLPPGPPRPKRRRRLPSFLKLAALPLALGAAAITISAAAGWASQVARLSDRIAEFKGTAIAASAHFGLTLQEVLVVGRRETDRGELLAAVGLKRGDTILTFDVDEARSRIEGLPWVKSAQVERAFPDAIRITIVEREPLALWQNEGRLQLIDIEGRPIRSGDLRRYRDLPILVGPDAPEHAPALLAMTASQPELARRVTAAVRVGGRRWNLRFDERLEVRLPEHQPATAFAHLAALQREHALLERDIVAVDLRFTDRLVVQLAPGAEDRLRLPERSTARQDARENGRT